MIAAALRCADFYWCKCGAPYLGDVSAAFERIQVLRRRRPPHTCTDPFSQFRVLISRPKASQNGGPNLSQHGGPKLRKLEPAAASADRIPYIANEVVAVKNGLREKQNE